MKRIFNKSMFKFLFIFGVFLISANLCNAVVSISVVPTATKLAIRKGDTTTINYAVSGGATRCFVDDGDLISILPASSGSFVVSPIVTTKYTITCDNFVAAPACNSYEVALSACFIADTKVILSDGSTKNIQDIKIGDVLKGETTNNTVLGFHDPKLENKKLYSFNGGRYFVTAEHPFKTIDGWKSIDPSLTEKENIGIKVTSLHIGDTLITENGKILLKTIDSKNEKVDTQLYNFLLNGDHTYYADGYLVHNKASCSSSMGYYCGPGQVCLDGSGMPSQEGICASCPGNITCNSGYTASCSGGFVVCTQTSCGTTTYNCTGTVAGSSPMTYEGQSCNQFTTSTTCLQGWLTHGCSWNGAASPTGACYDLNGNTSVTCSKYKVSSTCIAGNGCMWLNNQAL